MMVNGLNEVVLAGDDKLKKINEVATVLSKALKGKGFNKTWAYVYLLCNLFNLTNLAFQIWITDFTFYDNGTFLTYGLQVQMVL